MSSDANVSTVKANDNHVATRDNIETPVTTTTTTTGTAAAENTTNENNQLSQSGQSGQSATETSAARNEARKESDNTEGGPSKESKDSEQENKSSSNQATTTETNADITLATEIATQETPNKAVEEAGSSDQPQAVKETGDAGPELVITLLLTTGARHPLKIDGKYLRKRSVDVENDDPFNMSVYTLKELIWREWRSEWESQPSSPSSIRLIYFGKLLDDKSQLSESNLTHDAPNVIHMTVKPQEVVDEEDAKGGKSYSTRDRETSDRSPRCRCIIL